MSVFDPLLRYEAHEQSKGDELIFIASCHCVRWIYSTHLYYILTTVLFLLIGE